MNKDDMKEEFKAAAKAAGNLAKTGFNALSDQAEHNRQTMNIKNANIQADAAKSAARVPLILPLTASQRLQVDPAGGYNNIPGQMSITLDPNQENEITAHNINRIKLAGGQDYAALVKAVHEEHITYMCIPYLRIREYLYKNWLKKVVPNIDNTKPDEAVVINTSLEFRYKLVISENTMKDVSIPKLLDNWKSDVNLIMYAKLWGLHLQDIDFSNEIVVVKFQ